MMKEEDCQGMLRITKTRITFFLTKPCGGQKKLFPVFAPCKLPGRENANIKTNPNHLKKIFFGLKNGEYNSVLLSVIIV